MLVATSRSARTDARCGEWTPRELRHFFVSLMSDAGDPLMDTLFELPDAGASDAPGGELVPHLVPQRHEKSPSAWSAEGLLCHSDLRFPAGGRYWV